MRGCVFLVGAGPGDPGLLTLRAAEVLSRATFVLADRLVHPRILEQHISSTAELVVRPERRADFNQAKINATLIERAKRGDIVVRLKGGDPFIFGRGGEEAEALVDAGIPFEVVPGVTAAVAAPAMASIPLSHRELASAIVFATASPGEGRDMFSWETLPMSATLVLYMSVSHLGEVMQKLLAAGRAPDEKVAVIEKGTWPEQRTIVGTVADIAQKAKAAGVKPPALTVVGEVVALGAKLGQAVAPKRARILLLSSRRVEISVENAEVVQVSPFVVMPRSAAMRAGIEALSRCKSVAFASAHAVDVFFASLYAAGHDARALFGVRVCAVGEATATALHHHGLRADLVGSSGGTELAHDMVKMQTPGPVLVPRALGGRDDLIETLQSNGLTVEAIDAYETVTDEAALTKIARQQTHSPFSAVGFGSPRGVAAFLEHVRELPAKVGAIGETTRAALESAGVKNVIVPATPNWQALIDALAI